METYPGTDMVIRFCYSCQRKLEKLEDIWVDMDEDVCVCTDCKSKAEQAYPGETQFVRGSEFSFE